MTPDRIAWYRQQAERITVLYVAHYMDDAISGIDDGGLAEDYARLAAHFGRLALNQSAFVEDTAQHLDEQAERIAALEGALEEVLGRLDEALTLANLTTDAEYEAGIVRLRVVLGKPSG